MKYCLLLDATTGQNALIQAKTFKEATNVSGIVLTKLDGTAKGGIVLAIRNELKIPVKFVGLGEKMDDLQEFDAEKYVYGLFADVIDKEEELTNKNVQDLLFWIFLYFYDAKIVTGFLLTLTQSNEKNML